MIKILFVEIDPKKHPNPFLDTLITSVQDAGPDSVFCDWGKQKFWSNSAFEYNLIHIMWPQFILMGKTPEDLDARLKNLKEKGVKIVSTCHNLTPHYKTSYDLINSYNIVYNNSDLILHLGEYSLNIFINKFPNAKNYLLPHHIYDEKYKTFYKKEIAKYKLGLKEDLDYVLCFGSFRNYEERKLVMSIAKSLKKEKIGILAPNFYSLPRLKNIIKFLWSYILLTKVKIQYKNLIIKGKSVSEKDLPIYFGACDVVLIQRLKVLNSGNIPLAFHFGKVVVGPNVGNVSEILLETGNPVFSIERTNEIPEIIKQALILAKKDKGIQNKIYAEENLNSKKIGQTLYKYYVDLVN